MISRIKILRLSAFQKRRMSNMITTDQLLEVFASYNLQIWPMQIVAYFIAIAALYLAVNKSAWSTRGLLAILAFFWLWIAVMFWLPAAVQGFPPGYLFAALFLVQAGLLIYSAVRPTFGFALRKDSSSLAGVFFVFYAMVGYPLLGWLIGRVYPYTPPFGLTPCPLVTFTFGMFLLTTGKVIRTLLVIPFLYALSGIMWVPMGMWEDIGMLASGLIGVWLIWFNIPKRSLTKAAHGSGGRWSLDLSDKQ
jgi:hypothetical protein